MPTWIKLSLLFSLLIILALVLTNLGQDSTPWQIPTERNVQKPQEQQPNLTLEAILREDIPKLEGRWAVAIKGLNQNQSYFYNQDEIFTAASLYKLAVMWAAFNALDKGKLKSDQILSGQKAVLDQILEGKQNRNEGAGENSATLSYSVKAALDAMIAVSDNYSALLLAQHLGWTSIDQLMEKEGFADIDLASSDSPTVTARSVADLLERIYTNTAVDAQASEAMKNLLFAQTINDRIPKYLPMDVKVAHKTGELEGLRHDAGIVLGQNSHYIFVFLTETDSPNDAAETIAQLSKKIYDALEDKELD